MNFTAIWRKLFSLPIEVVDPEIFGHPLAKSTEWTPLSTFAPTYCTQRLRPMSRAGGWMFVRTWGVRYGMGLLFLGMITLGILAALYLDRGRGRMDWSFLLFWGILGLLGAGMFGWQHRRIPHYEVFDATERAFFMTNRDPRAVIAEQQDSYVPFSEIGALQLLRKYCRAGKHSYWAYELNLILQNGDRIHLVAHGKYQHLLKEAVTLAEWLDIPFWNVVEANAGTPPDDDGITEM